MRIEINTKAATTKRQCTKTKVASVTSSQREQSDALVRSERPRQGYIAPVEAAVTAEVEAQLRSGVLHPGDRINESALVTQLGFSRGPVREALRALERSGLVRIELNRGVFILKLSAKEVMDVYDLRATLFRFACKSACAKATAAWLRSLSELVDKMDQAVEVDDIDAYYPANVEFHNRIIERADNDRLLGFWMQLERQLHLVQRQGLVSLGAMRLSNSEHRRMLNALNIADLVTLESLAEQHMLEGKARLLANIALSVKSL